MEVKLSKKCQNPAYILRIDLGPDLGIKKTFSQIGDINKPDELIWTQVICWVNPESSRHYSDKCEVRALISDSAQELVHLRPAELEENGDTVYFG